MSGKLKAMRATECFEEFYGVDGDGLGEGEVRGQEELENETFSWSPGDNVLICARARSKKHTASGGKVSPKAHQRSC